MLAIDPAETAPDRPSRGAELSRQWKKAPALLPRPRTLDVRRRVDQYFATMASLPNFQLMPTRLTQIESLLV